MTRPVCLPCSRAGSSPACSAGGSASTEVAISDAFGAPGPSGRSAAATKALAAGVDVLLYTGEAAGKAGFAELLASARSGKLSTGRLQAAYDRVAALKARLGRR